MKSYELVLTAKEYAVKCHSETNHLYDGKPYEVHLQMVYDYAEKFAHLLPDEKTIAEAYAAAWVHDVIEDCRQTYNDVKKVCGETVADIAFALTNEKGKTRKERASEKYYEGILSNPVATYVKICDRLANVKYSKDRGSRMFEMYRKENEEFVRLLSDDDEYNVHYSQHPYKEMFDELVGHFQTAVG